MLAALQRKVDAVAVEVGSNAPDCPQCGRPMGHHDTRPATWLAHWGHLHIAAPRYRSQDYRVLTILTTAPPFTASCPFSSLAEIVRSTA
jgi:hypothetical protein